MSPDARLELAARLAGALGLLLVACSRPPEPVNIPVTTPQESMTSIPPPLPSPTPQIQSIPWAEFSLGKPLEGEPSDSGFKEIKGNLWIKNKTPQWQWLDFSTPLGERYPIHSLTDSGAARHQANLYFSSTHGIYDRTQRYGKDGMFMPPKATVRFQVQAQIPAKRQAQTLNITFSDNPTLTLPFIEGQTPTGLFDNMADFPATSSDNTLVCARDRSITVKFRDIVQSRNPYDDSYSSYANFDLLIHNSSGHTITLGDYTITDYPIIREAWSADGIFRQTGLQEARVGGPPISPDLDGTGSMGVRLASEFDYKKQRFAPPTFPQLIRITIYPNVQRQPNQPPCDKKEMLFRVDEPRIKK